MLLSRPNTIRIVARSARGRHSGLAMSLVLGVSGKAAGCTPPQPPPKQPPLKTREWDKLPNFQLVWKDDDAPLPKLTDDPEQPSILNPGANQRQTEKRDPQTGERPWTNTDGVEEGMSSVAHIAGVAL